MFDDDRIAICNALNSGKYKKCRDWLRKGDCYDVFGVMCDVLNDGSWQWLKWERDPTASGELLDLFVFEKKDGSASHVAGLPEFLRQRLEFEPDDVGKITALNDGKGDWNGRPQPFEFIARWIDFHY